MHPQTIIFIGPQGSGKGTQLEKLDAVLRAHDAVRRVVAIQTGRLFRALAKRNETKNEQERESYTQRRVSETLDAGTLQPDFLTATLWGEAMIQHVDPTCHLLIEGFPRTVAQAKVLESAFDFYERKDVTVLNLTVSDAVAKARMQSRARPDDTAVAIAERLRLYTTETLPVIDFYRTRPHTTVLDIDATGSIESIHEAILSGLGLAQRGTVSTI